MTSEPNEFVRFNLNGHILIFWRSHSSATNMDKVKTDQIEKKEKIKK